MGVKVKFEKRPEGGFAITFEDDGSGDLDRVMDDLCEKHLDDKSPQSSGEIFTEIAKAVGESGPPPIINENEHKTRNIILYEFI